MAATTKSKSKAKQPKPDTDAAIAQKIEELRALGVDFDVKESNGSKTLEDYKLRIRTITVRGIEIQFQPPSITQIAMMMQGITSFLWMLPTDMSGQLNNVPVSDDGLKFIVALEECFPSININDYKLSFVRDLIIAAVDEFKSDFA